MKPQKSNPQNKSTTSNLSTLPHTDLHLFVHQTAVYKAYPRPNFPGSIYKFCCITWIEQHCAPGSMVASCSFFIWSHHTPVEQSPSWEQLRESFPFHFKTTTKSSCTEILSYCSLIQPYFHPIAYKFHQVSSLIWLNFILVDTATSTHNSHTSPLCYTCFPSQILSGFQNNHQIIGQQHEGLILSYLDWNISKYRHVGWFKSLHSNF